MVPGAIVVGTGRCGSTLLSNLLREHDDVLSLSEFWPNRLNLPQLFGEDLISGEDYWGLLSVPLAPDIIKIAHVVKMSQVPSRTLHESNGMRRIALPSITEDYDALFGEIGDYVCSRPQSTPADHVSAMFGFIAAAMDKKVWVERTGASIDYLPLWKHMWPNQKIVHMYRDGRDVALSMSKHHAFRLMIARAERHRNGAWLDIRPLDAETLDVQQFMGRDIPLSQFGRLWNRMIVEGVEQLKCFPPENQYSLRYEDLMADPAARLTDLLAFVAPDLDPEPWVQRCAARLQRPRNDWRTLDPHSLADLTAACRAGLDILGYHELAVA